MPADVGGGCQSRLAPGPAMATNASGRVESRPVTVPVASASTMRGVLAELPVPAHGATKARGRSSAACLPRSRPGTVNPVRLQFRFRSKVVPLVGTVNPLNSFTRNVVQSADSNVLMDRGEPPKKVGLLPWASGSVKVGS